MATPTVFYFLITPLNTDKTIAVGTVKDKRRTSDTRLGIRSKLGGTGKALSYELSKTAFRL